MNPILQVKLNFSDENNTASPKGRNLSSKAETTVEKIDVIIDSLNAVLRYYRNSPRYVSGCLIDANYNDIIAKSKRIKELIKPLRQSTNDVVGKCPECSSDLIKRMGRYGEFIGCSGFPKCRFTSSIADFEAAQKENKEKQEDKKEE